MPPEIEVRTLSLPRPSIPYRAIGTAQSRIGRTYALSDRLRPILNRYAELLSKSIADERPDVVLSTTSLCLQGRQEIPVVAWPDAPLPMMIEDRSEYPVLAAMTPVAIRREVVRERRLLSNTDIIALPTNRAIRSISPLRAVRAPFGPNIESSVLDQIFELRSRSDRARGNSISILFNGVDWRRKGGDVALETVRQLRQSGRSVSLHVIGARPPVDDPSIHWEGRLNLDSEADRIKYIELTTAADVVLFPTRADNFGAVIAECAASGIPVVSSTRAGAAEYVESGHFGLVVGDGDGDEYDLAERAAQYVQAVESIVDRPALATQFMLAGRNTYKRVLDYRLSIRSILDELSK